MGKRSRREGGREKLTVSQERWKKNPDETDSRNYIAEEYESAEVPRTGGIQCAR